jgi:hypothetical protein
MIGNAKTEIENPMRMKYFFRKTTFEQEKETLNLFPQKSEFTSY